MRDMIQTASKMNGQFIEKKGLNRYELSFDEITMLRNMIQDDKTIEAIITAFKYGFVLGHRATVTGTIKGKI